MTTYSARNLTGDDVQAISVALSFPSGVLTRDPEELMTRLRQMDPSADEEWLYHRLASAHDVRLMIAAAALRGVQRLPPDPRLDPAPYPLRPSLRALQDPTPTPTDYPRDPDEPTLPADDAVVAEVDACAAAPGSRRALRYRVWQVGATIGELRAAGLRVSDMRRDLAAGRVRLRWPTGETLQ